MSFGISAAGWIAGAAVAGTVVQARSASKAAKAQEKSAQAANDTQLEMYYQSRDDQEPWRKTGEKSLNQLAKRIGLNGGSGDLMRSFSAKDFTVDPGYQFRLGEGQKALTNSAAARGGLLSGAAAKALTRYNQNIASDEYGNAFNRFQTNQTNQFNRLASLANVGQVTANQTANRAVATGEIVGNNLLAGGAARASGYIGQNNALMGGVNTLYGLGKNSGWFGDNSVANGPATNADGSYNYDANGWWDVNSWGKS